MGVRATATKMPLSPLQQDILRVIASNRSVESHFAGGMILNAGEQSARYSHDFDIFHDAEVEVDRASRIDVQSLTSEGFVVEKCAGDWTKATSFRKARVVRGDEKVEIDWAADSAFRFFPIEQDELLGWRLHLFDMATNKALALAARSVTRDYVDIVELNQIYPLHAIIWAACGKDPGFTPLLLLEMMRRFARINPRQLETIQARALDPVELKRSWIKMSDFADIEITRIADTMPDLPIGVAFIDEEGRPGWIGENPALRPHAPSVRGCLPQLGEG